MKFGPVPVDQAAGAVLAHSTKTASGRISKGRVLAADDIAALKQAGLAEVIAARLAPEDVGENEAAAELAQALAAPGLVPGNAGTGRCNLHAETRGLLCVDENGVAAFNAVDEAVTLATLRPFAVVDANQMVATVKIINFAVARTVLDAAKTVTDTTAPLISIAPFAPRRAALIQTRLPGSKKTLVAKAETVTRARLARIDATLEATAVCDHDIESVAGALREAAEKFELILLIGASAIMDRDDIIPSALVAAGGSVDRLGIPVDPGNLTMVGSLGDTAVVAMPGSARSPRLHGTDWILERIAAGLPIAPSDFARMGVGGLLKEIPGRPSPRDRADRRAAKADAAAIAALVLAAGQSSRMGARNKLLEPVGGVPMIRRVVDTLAESKASSVTVVTGHQADEVAAALDGSPARLVHNPDYAEGMSTSLRAGIDALPADAAGALICLGDMPAIAASVVDRMIGAFDPATGREIVVVIKDGRRGNPVLLGRRIFFEVRDITGDQGARSLIERHAGLVVEEEVDDDAIFLDLDTPEALDAFAKQSDGDGRD